MSAITLTFANELPNVIDGRLVTRRTEQEAMLAAAGISLSQVGRLATVRLGNQNVTLRNWRVITRPSGRKHRHLSWYLVGLLEHSTQVVEIFLGVVEKTRGLLFRLRASLQQGLLRLAAAVLSPGLSAPQKIAAVLYL